VGDTDIDNIGLRAMAPEEIHAHLEFDDEMARHAPQDLDWHGAPGAAQPRRIMLLSVNEIGQMYQGDVAEDGAFTIAKVSPGNCTVRVEGYGGFVKSVRLGETTGEGSIVNLSQGTGGARLTVTLSSAYGEIAGTVRDDKGPAAGVRVLLRHSQEIRPNLGMVAFRGGGTRTTQADGTYRFQLLAPGTYKLLVLDDSEPQTMTGEPDPDDFDARAETVEVLPKQTVTHDLKVK